MSSRRSKIQREKDLLIIEKRYLRGESQSAIARDLTVSQQSVSSDIKLIIKRWRKETTLDLDDQKTQELTKINNLETTYWGSWNKSREDALTSMAVPGDPRFLAGVQWCINKRCEILGIDAPVKTETKTEITTKVSKAENERAISLLSDTFGIGVPDEGTERDGAMGSTERPAV